MIKLIFIWLVIIYFNCVFMKINKLLLIGLLWTGNCLAESEETPAAPLQDHSGTPIYLTPKASTPEPTITPGPVPTPMKVANIK